MSAKRINKCKDVENMLQNKDRNVLKTDRERERESSTKRNAISFYEILRINNMNKITKINSKRFK